MDLRFLVGIKVVDFHSVLLSAPRTGVDFGIRIFRLSVETYYIIIKCPRTKPSTEPRKIDAISATYPKNEGDMTDAEIERFSAHELRKITEAWQAMDFVLNAVSDEHED